MSILTLHFTKKNVSTKTITPDSFTIQAKHFDEMIVLGWEQDLPVNQKIFSLTILTNFIRDFYIERNHELVLDGYNLESFWLDYLEWKINNQTNPSIFSRIIHFFSSKTK